MSSRVYVGNLSSRATERDVEHFFKGFGRIRDIMLKNGFGFVEFEDSRDADDAVYEQNGRDLCGERVVVELSRGNRGGYGGGRSGGRDGGGGGARSADGRVNGRYPPPMQTRYRLIVTNLSTRFSWQDLKDMMRSAGDVTYADAHRRTRNEALVCFGNHEDLKRAIDKFQGKEINGRRIKCVDDTEGGRGGSRSRRRSGGSRSRSRSRSSRRSRSARRSRSRSPPSRSRSRSGSPAGSDKVKNGGGSGGGAKRSRTPSSRSSSVASKKSAKSEKMGGEEAAD